MEYKPALRYHSPTAAERGTKPVTVERSAEHSDKCSVVMQNRKKRQLVFETCDLIDTSAMCLLGAGTRVGISDPFRDYIYIYFMTI